ncbi:MAG: aldose 1-epimerase [Rhodobacteraceae bacterium]|nr:aldose 1-epimerase [Paracoccaceae bacterium]
MAAASELRLAAGPLSIDLAPGIGGSVGALRWRGRNVLRPLSEADRAAGDVLGVAAFPMLPVANRIAGNAFRFEGRAFAVAANNPPERFHVHGTGWRAAWTVAEASPTTARFDLVQTEPWPFRASQSFTPTADALDLRLTLENAGRERAPFGFGWHPWFPRDPDAQLRFRASRFYLEEPEGVSGDAISLPPELDFSTGAQLPTGWRNNCYGGWDGHATVTLPARGLALEMTATPELGHLQFYADPAKPYFCLEPQSMASGAFNRPSGWTTRTRASACSNPARASRPGCG